MAAVPTYDTLSDYSEDTEELQDFSQLYTFLFGSINLQDHVCSIVSGPVSPVNSETSTWGTGWNDGGLVVYVRSCPRGRMAMPLLKNEMRTTSILLMCAHSGQCKVSLVRQFLSLDLTPPDLGNLDMSTMNRLSVGPLSVPVVAPMVFEGHATMAVHSEASCFAHNSDGYRLILPSSATIVDRSSSGKFVKSVSTGNHVFAIAEVIVGVPIHDRVRRPVERIFKDEWAASQLSLMKSLACKLRSSSDPSLRASDALIASRMVCEDISVNGFMDVMSQDIGCGGLPEDFKRPMGFPLVIAMITRIAAYPSRYDLNIGQPNDVYAANEIAIAFESNQIPVMTATALAENLEAGDTHRMFAIDLAINLALVDTKQEIENAIRQARSNEIREACMDREVHNESLEALFRMGTSLLIDVAGPTPVELYGKFGFAHKVCDAATLSRIENAASNGLGKLGVAAPPLRGSSKAERQAKLLKILHDVECWLKTGKFQGTQVSRPNSQNYSLNTKPKPFKHDSLGFQIPPSYKTTFNVHRDAGNICIDALNVARHQLGSILSRGPVSLSATMDFHVVVGSNHSQMECADCPRKVGAIEAFCFASGRSLCASCSRPRCKECAVADEALAKQNCLRCMHQVLIDPATGGGSSGGSGGRSGGSSKKTSKHKSKQ